MMPEPLIALRNVEKSFSHGVSRTFVLRRITLDIAQGEFVSVMGPSGAGKSTLLHILGMHDAAWAGEYDLLGQPVHGLRTKHRQALGRSHDVPLSYRNVPRPERQGLVADTLDRFQIVGKKDLYPSQLSGGQQQLVGVARALIARPKLILADEPTGNLHSSQGREIMELFTKLNAEGTTIVQVTHSDANAAYGTRIIQLRDGWLVDE